MQMAKSLLVAEVVKCLLLSQFYLFCLFVCEMLSFLLPCCLQMLSFMHAQSTFFHQGHDLFADLDPHMKDIASQVSVFGS